MGTTLRRRLGQESGFGKGSLDGLGGLGSGRPGASELSTAKSRLVSRGKRELTPPSPASEPSSDGISEIAPEIIVWTGDMEIYSPTPDDAPPDMMPAE